MKDLIFFENEDYIIARKPAGLVAEEDSSGSRNLRQTLELYIRETYPWKKQLICQLVNRLDKPVGGLLICAKKQSILKHLQNQFYVRTVKKYYFAVVEGRPHALQSTLKNFVLKSEQAYRAEIANAEAPGAKEASLHYRVLSHRDAWSLLLVELHTGKFHQIRIQLSHIGCPIWNDVQYGATLQSEESMIGLYSFGLQFTDPKSEKKQTFVCVPSTENIPWNHFKEEIQEAASGLFPFTQ